MGPNVGSDLSNRIHGLWISGAKMPDRPGSLDRTCRLRGPLFGCVSRRPLESSSPHCRGGAYRFYAGWSRIGHRADPSSGQGRSTSRSYRRAPAWRETWRWKRVALLCFVLLFLFRMASTPRVFSYLNVDDENFYLAVPVKMMTAHHLAADPYSERRIESSVGGNFFAVPGDEFPAA